MARWLKYLYLRVVYNKVNTLCLCHRDSNSMPLVFTALSYNLHYDYPLTGENIVRAVNRQYLKK